MGRGASAKGGVLTEPVHLTIPGVPVPKGRPRVVVIGKYPSLYTPKKTKEYERRVGRCARPFFREALCGPLIVEAVGWWPMKGQPLKRSTRPVQWYEGSADVDNVLKSVLDGLNGVAYHDDKQVVRAEIHGYRCPQERNEPRVELRIAPAGEPRPPFWLRV